ncbi:AT-hook motif nuclear-localized protein 28-like [Aegilops tauschii subsp. strangulata]|uniref:AT-hook motif nuclear-localized protein 28-like n=1 Tax=Aegilops tauschii subsp. strangulata TaxID=200361 RepID=UPI00098B0487|nr:AT-hook motif nuclear-localized protein 29-like [Aegilops tauschii subsp. strangulata]
MAGNEGTSLAQLIEPTPAPELALLPQPQASAQGATPASARAKPRGRPPGSRNKPKPPVVVVRESAGAMRPVVLELAAGCDVAGAVAAFARRRGVGVSVLCGRGALAAVTLRLSTSAGTSRAVRLDGRFDVLSLSGTVLPAGAGAATTPFSVSLAGADGQVVGGTLAGEMTPADGGVLLVAATFVTAEVHRLPAVEAEPVVEGDGGRGGRQEEEKRPPTSPPPPPQQQQQHEQHAMVAASAADVGHVAAHGGVLGWGPGGHPGQVGHYAQHAEQMLSPWGVFPDSRAAPNHPASSSHHHYL